MVDLWKSIITTTTYQYDCHCSSGCALGAAYLFCVHKLDFRNATRMATNLARPQYLYTTDKLHKLLVDKLPNHYTNINHYTNSLINAQIP